MTGYRPLLDEDNGSSSDGLWRRMRSMAADYKAVLIPAAGNLSASYNICNIGYVVQLLRLEHPVPRWAAPAFSASCLFGAFIGQLVLGWAGDRYGRRKALMATHVIIVIGALGSAFLTNGYGDHIWLTLVHWRFVLGLGVGGTLPLTAVFAGEMSDDRGLGRVSRVAMSTACQIAGYILAPALMFFIVLILGSDKITEEPWATDLGWRTLLGLGALPSVFALREMYLSPDIIEDFTRPNDRGIIATLQAAASTVAQDARYGRRFAAAAGSLACFNFSLFGMVIYLPHILHAVVDKDDEGRTMLLVGAALAAGINALAIPAASLATRLIVDDGIGRKRLQVLSFSLICVAYLILGLTYPSFKRINAAGWIVAFFGALFFALNSGAGMTAYILPQEAFPADVRSTLISAAAATGTVGALVSSYAFAPLARQFGLSFAFFCCCVAAAAGTAITWLLSDDSDELDLLGVEESEGSRAAGVGPAKRPPAPQPAYQTRL